MYAYRIALSICTNIYHSSQSQEGGSACMADTSASLASSALASASFAAPGESVTGDMSSSAAVGEPSSSCSGDDAITTAAESSDGR